MLKPQIDDVNMSTVCDKRELELGVDGPKLRYSEMAGLVIKDVFGGQASGLLRRSENFSQHTYNATPDTRGPG